ncbi:hypothetical protein BMS96_08105 [Leuconostoc lactis]|nr:hypothetical protein BMS94_08020 [Leuconostoc lactis]ORI85795.1 hypothetical protein BMS96_08105 [Leuconostoc lactis]
MRLKLAHGLKVCRKLKCLCDGGPISHLHNKTIDALVNHSWSLVKIMVFLKNMINRTTAVRSRGIECTIIQWATQQKGS